jgi:tRNA-2-methylthio-N6-dimethylallyladenosine synthase
VRRGWAETEEDAADVVIFTGCSVRDKSEHKIWSQLGRYEERWKRCRAPVVAVTGCVAQSVGRDMLSRFPWVRLVSGPRHIGLLPDGLESILAGNERVLLLDEDPRAFIDLPEAPLNRVNPWRAFLTVAHGCDNFCTYCIVPYVRGRFVSRPMDDILDEVRLLVDDGVLEITLLGQNVNSYGKDFGDGTSFASLLDRVAAAPGLRRLRFATSLPQDFTESILAVMAKHPNICPSVNLPVQAGSDRILKAMNRRYGRKEYLSKVALIRSYLPTAALTTDLIVGFPGETEGDFCESLDLLRSVRFEQVHSAAYSPRSGTPAALYPDQIPWDVKQSRLNRVNRLQMELTLENNRPLLGTEHVVLFDGHAPHGERVLQGRTPQDKIVLVAADDSRLGTFANVRLTASETWCLRGEII